jgi:hypothetical protein
MKKFLAIYQSSAESTKQMQQATPEQTAEMMGHWMKWKAANEKHIVDFGAPLMSGAVMGSAASYGTVSGYSVLQAESIEELKAACSDHPHQNMEILECINM